MGLQFVELKWLFLFIPAFFVLYRFVIAMPRDRRYVYAALRVVASSCLIVALTLPSLTIAQSSVRTIYLLDQSASTMAMTTPFLQQIDEAREQMASDDRYAIVAFAKRAIVHQTWSTKRQAVQQNVPTLPHEETNIEQAIYVALSLLERDEKARLVLLSDRKETEGEMERALAQMKRENVTLDVWNGAVSEAKDVALMPLELPSVVYGQEKTTTTMTVKSTVAGTATLQLTLDGVVWQQNVLAVKRGTQQVKVTLPKLPEGTHRLVAKVTMANDEVEQNNRVEGFFTSKAARRVLLVDGDGVATNNIATMMTSAGLAFERIEAASVPSALNRYLLYDSIVFVNVSAPTLPEGAMRAIATAVEQYGKGFIMIGGDQSYGLGGFYKTPIEKIMPVQMKIKAPQKLEKTSLSLIIDHSGSMSGMNMYMAKEAAIQAIDLLRPVDEVQVIVFDGSYTEIIPLQSAKGKAKMVELISMIEADGGTDIYPALAAGITRQMASPLKNRHVILLTDGQSGMPGNYSDIIVAGYNEKITVSTVAIGLNTDESLLSEIAGLGGGRAYVAATSEQIPAILTRETALAMREYMVRERQVPTRVEESLFRSLSAPGEIEGYVATTLKPSATPVLLSKRKEAIVAYTQAGLGRTFAVTTDATGQLNGAWGETNSYSEWMTAIVKQSFQTVTQSTVTKTWSEAADRYTMEVAGVSSTLQAKATDEAGKEVATTVVQSGPDTYKVSVPKGKSVYAIALHKNGKLLDEAQFVVPYSREYAIEPIDYTNAKRWVQQIDGRAVTALDASFRPLPTPTVEPYALSDWLVLLAFSTMMIEWTIRRFNLFRWEAVKHRWPRGRDEEREQQASSTSKLLEAKKRQQI